MNDDVIETPPDAQRVARRAMVLISVAKRAFLEREGTEESKEDLKDLQNWISKLSLWDECEPDERKVLRTPIGNNPQDQAFLSASWLCEGAAVLAWALERLELPLYDQAIDPQNVVDALRVQQKEAADLIDNAKLRHIAELERYNSTVLALHWRLREYSNFNRERIDFQQFVRECKWAVLNLDGVRLINGDLALGKKQIDESSDKELRYFTGLAYERHRASNWLLGGWGTVYSEVDTST